MSCFNATLLRVIVLVFEGVILLKKGIVFLFIFLFILVIVISGVGVYLYWKGPDYALSKVKELAQSRWNTRISYKQASLIGSKGFFIGDLLIQNEKIHFFAKKFEVRWQVSLDKQQLTISQILLEQPDIQASVFLKPENSVKSKSKQEEMSAETSADYSALEDFILSPSPKFDFHQLLIKELSADIKIIPATEQSLSSAIRVQKLNSTLEVQKNSESLRLIFDLQSKGVNQIELQDSQKLFRGQGAGLLFKLNLLIKHEPKGGWSYEIEPMEFASEFKNLYFQSQSGVAVNSPRFKTQIEAKTQCRSERLFELSLQQCPSFLWKANTQASHITGTGHSAFQWVTKKGLDFRGDIQGALSPSPPSISRFDLPWSWDIKYNLQAGPWQFEGTQSQIKTTGEWNNNKGRVRISTYPLSVVQFDSQLELNSSSLKSDSKLQLDLPEGLTEKLIQKKIQGSLVFPFQWVMSPPSNTQEIYFKGMAQLKNFSYSDKQFKVTGVNGQIPLTERLIYQPTRGKVTQDQSSPSPSPSPSPQQLLPISWSFQDIITQNPFERADYQRFDPLVRSSELFRIQEIQWENVKYGPFRGAIEVEQNRIALHQFILDLSKGSLGGEFFIDLNQKNQQMGFLGRLTQVNLSDILPSRFLMKDSTSSALPLNARLGLLLSINKKNLEGRLDFNEIGGPQLMTLINVLDPNFENVKMNKVRSILQVGYPTALSMSFHDGMTDLSMDLEALNLKSHHQISGISIQSFIDKALDFRSNTKTNLRSEE